MIPFLWNHIDNFENIFTVNVSDLLFDMKKQLDTIDTIE